MRVRPEAPARQKPPHRGTVEDLWDRRCRETNNWEQNPVDSLAVATTTRTQAQDQAATEAAERHPDPACPGVPGTCRRAEPTGERPERGPNRRAGRIL